MRMHPELIRYWNKAPFLLPLAGLVTGILEQAQFSLSPLHLLVQCLGAFIGIFVFFSLPLRIRFQQFRWGTVFSFLLFVSVGAALTQLKDIRQYKNWIGHFIHPDTFIDMELTISTAPIEKEKTVKFLGQAEWIQTIDNIQQINGNVILYVAKGHSIQPLQPGDRMIIYKAPSLIEQAGNPGEMNVVRHYAQENCTHRVFLKEGEYQLLKKRKAGYGLARFLFQLKKWIIQQLHQNIPDKKAAGLAIALLIGYREELEAELSQVYANTGVVHIIAISGMHLALIGWLLQQLLLPLKKNSAPHRFAQLIIVSVIWLFSLLADATPSVLRAAISFSLIALGVLINRKPNSLNSLFAAGFFLLLFQPLWLWNLGFQLSFLAVLSILLFAPSLQRVGRKLPSWIHTPYQLIAVTIAAQLLTVPVSIYYFHQFPASFLGSNLIAIPLSTLLLYCLIALLTIGMFQPIGNLLGWIAIQLIELMNGCMEWIAQLPGLLWTRLYWTAPEAILLSILFLLIGHWIINQSRRAFVSTLFVIIALLLLQVNAVYTYPRQKKLIVYNHSAITALTWIHGRYAISFAKRKDMDDSTRLAYLIQPCYAVYQIRQSQLQLIQPLISIGSCTLLIPDRNRLPPPTADFPINYLLISRVAPFQGESWIKSRRIQFAILDGTIGPQTRIAWRKQLTEAGIPFYDMKQSGAFVHSL